MNEWKNNLKADPTEWLLEENNPSVRYFTLRDILDKNEDDPEVQKAKENIALQGIVPEILAKQREESYRNTYRRFYTDKYRGLVWSLILLCETGVTAGDEIKAQCEYLLRNSQELSDGGFSMAEAVKTGGGRLSEVIPCLTGNLLWCLLHFGYVDDLRVKKGLSFLMRHMRYNDGIELDPQCAPYDKFEMCWGAHTCHMGVVKALKAFSAVPESCRTRDIAEAIDKAVEFLLLHHIYKRSHDLSKTAKPGWKSFGFPLMYQTDVVEILDLLTQLGFHDERMEDAVQLVLRKQRENGRWVTENTYCSDRLVIPFSAKGEESKWITLRAVRILKRYFGE